MILESDIPNVSASHFRAFFSLNLPSPFLSENTPVTATGFDFEFAPFALRTVGNISDCMFLSVTYTTPLLRIYTYGINFFNITLFNVPNLSSNFISVALNPVSLKYLFNFSVISFTTSVGFAKALSDKSTIK
nr:MAG TPA_asm: hypothetical protein [Bacteriophage sp.]